MKHTRVVSTKCTPGFACRAFSDTTLVCFIVNEHTTKCSRYILILLIDQTLLSVSPVELAISRFGNYVGTEAMADLRVIKICLR